MNKSILLLALLSSTIAPGLEGAAPELRLTLKEAENLALSSSPSLQSAEKEFEAVQNQVTSQKSYLFPTLTLDGSYRWVSEIPSMQVAPGRTIPLTDHRSNSVGLGASWQIWDWGAALQAYRGVQSQAESKRHTQRGSKRQTLLTLRLDYFQVQMASEQTRIISDNLKLAQAQYRDIHTRYQAGASSRADALFSHQEVLTWKRSLRQARSDLAQALRDLYAASGREPGLDLSLPLDAQTAKDPPADIEPASCVISLDGLPESLAALQEPGGSGPDATLPQAAAYDALALSMRHNAKANRATLLPRVQLQARASYDYPNGPVRETIQQNMVGVSASMPLFDWGRTRSQARASGSQAEALERRRDQVLSDTRRDWNKARDQLASLTDQQKLNRQSIEEAQELAALVYSSYKNGRSSFLEVESANLKALQAKVLSARTDVQVLMQRALLIALSKEE